MIQIEVKTAFESCDKCSYYRLETSTFTADNGEQETIFYCKHWMLCQNAVKIWHKEERKEE